MKTKSGSKLRYTLEGRVDVHDTRVYGSNEAASMTNVQALQTGSWEMEPIPNSYELHSRRP